ncbi:cytochrome c1 [Sphingomonas sp. LB-2]|uniref:cytochrome c1 n=1 Tax=Sphingomonas caeni TaxID=2984949 RepID=UPI00222EDA89|nr:cytochrome c1 [Sphingomonas caeni]MCW3848925.1 cytochrome c1 [Sphingomonas caeni]
MLPLFVRSIKFLVGGGFIFVLLIALYGTITAEKPAVTAEQEFHLHPKEDVTFSFDNPVLGKFDVAQLQRGYQVYQEVCAACHSLSLVSFRELKGLGYNDAQVKKLASDFDNHAKQPTLDPKTGDRGERGNLPSDHFPHIPYSGNGTPPDLSLITKARHGGARYVYSILTGYADQNGYKNEKGQELLREFPGAKSPPGTFFNPYFANLNIAMPKPLTSDGQVTYLDGTRATVPQMAQDVSAFLTWASEPTMETRKQTGLAVVLFLLVTTLLAFGAYRTVWAGVKH